MELIDSMYWQKVHQRSNMRVLPIDYNSLLMEEWEKIESFSKIQETLYVVYGELYNRDIAYRRGVWVEAEISVS